MNPSGLKVTGAWFQVGGNLTAAIGTTRGFMGEEKAESKIVIVGSSLQALGYILQIIASNETEDEGERENQSMCLENKSEMLDKVGIELLALGNISNVIGTYFNIKEQLKENDYLIIIGNSLQSIGAFFWSRSGFAPDENGTENYNTRQFSAKFRGWTSSVSRHY